MNCVWGMCEDQGLISRPTATRDVWSMRQAWVHLGERERLLFLIPVCSMDTAIDPLLSSIELHGYLANHHYLIGTVRCILNTCCF